MKILKGIRGHPLWSKIWKTHYPRCSDNISRGFFLLGFKHLILNGLNEIDLDCGFAINFCVVYFLIKAHNHLISSNAT